MAYDQIHQRLACTSHNGRVRLHRLERDGELLKCPCPTPVLSVGRRKLGGTLDHRNYWTYPTYRHVRRSRTIAKRVLFGDWGNVC